MKQVQISEDLFLSLIKYHILEYTNDKEKIVKELQQKFDRVINRELYTQYKTASSEEEKEKARQEYLNRKGMHSSFRW
ncbi:complexin-2 [Lachnospiraceae bacterium 46-61]